MTSICPKCGWQNRLDARFCQRCFLPLPEGEFESYDFCPYCSKSLGGLEPRMDESRKIIGRELKAKVEIQCGECGCECDPLYGGG